MNNELKAWSVDGYLAIMADLLGQGYRVVDYHKVQPAERQLIVRHDVDMCPTCALDLAKAEAAHGIRAWYFFLLRSELYNPFAPAVAAQMASVRALGHGVGLHFDAAQYGDHDRAGLDAGAARECAWLEGLLEGPVDMISFHRPHRSLLGDDENLAGRPHAYQPRFFDDIGYCSDSRGEWGHGHPLDHPAVVAGTALQLLTHPIWWCEKGGATPRTRLDAFVARRDAGVRSALARECSVYPTRG